MLNYAGRGLSAANGPAFFAEAGAVPPVTDIPEPASSGCFLPVEAMVIAMEASAFCLEHHSLLQARDNFTNDAASKSQHADNEDQASDDGHRFA